MIAVFTRLYATYCLSGFCDLHLTKNSQKELGLIVTREERKVL